MMVDGFPLRRLKIDRERFRIEATFLHKAKCIRRSAHPPILSPLPLHPTPTPFHRGSVIEFTCSVEMPSWRTHFPLRQKSSPNRASARGRSHRGVIVSRFSDQGHETQHNAHDKTSLKMPKRITSSAEDLTKVKITDGVGQRTLSCAGHNRLNNTGAGSCKFIRSPRLLRSEKDTAYI